MTKYELIFVGFVLLFFFLLYLIERLVDRVLVVWMMRWRSTKRLLFYLFVVIALGSLFLPEMTQLALAFLFETIFKTGQVIFAAITSAIARI